jgi:hypothetical protein
MILRAVLLSVAFVLATDPSQAAAQLSFKCSADRGICTCDANILGDCELMKKNCNDGKIGWCRPGSTKCSCALPTAKILSPQLPLKMQRR